MVSHAIDIDNLSVRRDGPLLLRDFSLQVEPGQKVVVTGPSGCGKSTLLACILGFVQPHSGRITIMDTELDSGSIWTLRRHIGYVAQEPDLGHGTVEEVVDRPFRYRANRSLSTDLDQLPAWMERLGLAWALRKKRVAELSGGEKQRVALITALMLKRDILLLDEITSALDKDRRASVLDILRRSHSTMLVVSHDDAVFAMADHIVEMRPAEATA